MGLGDWIMATGQVRRIHAETGLQVCVVGFGRRPQWSEVFENSPKIARNPRGPIALLKNCGGARPYILTKTPRRWVWRDWDIEPGEIFLSESEREFAEPFRGRVLIEPSTKVADGNKSWPFARWREVVAQCALEFVQVGKSPSQKLPGVECVATTFRQAMAILSVCSAYVGPEGALHHAAAALGVRAVVLWSEFIEPRYTGYAGQVNLRHAGPACGSRVPCDGCRRSLDAISTDEVADALMEVCGEDNGRRVVADMAQTV